jgi:rRNA maturation endonuclease Nob1
MPEHTAAEVRTAIERELRERLEAARASSAPRLQCVACRHLNPLDAGFCTSCGTQFNAVVVGGSAAMGR